MSRTLRQITLPAAAGAAALLLYLSLGGSVPRAAAASSPADRSGRQVRLMSRILDDALIESRNWLVRGGGVTQGVYLSDFGAVFQFEASVNADDLHGIWIGPGSRVEIDKDADGDIVVKKKHGLSQLFAKDDEKKIEAERARLYQKGKEELIQTLVDNAEVLSALPAAQAVVISVSLTDGALRENQDVRRILIRVPTDDLRAFGENRLSETDLKGRIRVEES